MESSKNNRISSGMCGGWLAMLLAGGGSRLVSKKRLFETLKIYIQYFKE
jgi:hypothetical protein